MSGFNHGSVLRVAFWCLDCNTPLDAISNIDGMSDIQHLTDDGGRFALHHAAVFKVRPCKTCIDKELAPARQLQEAIAKMSKGAGQ